MRRAARVDANQQAVIDALRAHGAYVWIIGLPVDLLVGYKGHTFLMEVKDGPKKKLTNLQEDFFMNWPGATLCRVDGPESAVRMLKTADSVEPFGHFKVGPFGWTDCAETDEGAIPLFERPI